MSKYVMHGWFAGAAYAAQGHEHFYSKVAECVPDGDARQAIASAIKGLHSRYWQQILKSVEVFGKLLTSACTLAAVPDTRPADQVEEAAVARLQGLLEENRQLQQRSDELIQSLKSCDEQEEAIRAELTSFEPRSALGRTLGDPKVVEQLTALAEDARVARQVIAQCKGWLDAEGGDRQAPASGGSAAVRIKPGLTASEMQACLDAMQLGV
jgi:hypothetical protein